MIDKVFDGLGGSMDVSSIELLFVALGCAAIAIAQYKKAEEQRRKMVEGIYEEVTYLDVALLVVGFALLVVAMVFAFLEFNQNGFTVAVIFVGFKWGILAVGIREAKYIHRALRPLLGV